MRDAPIAVDTWNRSRQCADDSERLATRLQREAAPYQRGPKVLGWSNHYNRKESRCYVEIAYNNPTPEKGLAPHFYQELYDAIEGLQLASHTNERMDEVGRGIWCQIRDPSDPRSIEAAECAAAKKFIADRMTN